VLLLPPQYNGCVRRSIPRGGRKASRRKDLESEKLAKAIVDLIVAKLGEDVLLLDIQPLSTIADYFIMCSGTSERQLEAIHEHIRAELKEMHVRPTHLEGTGRSGWMLMDYGSVIVHIFLSVTRQYYDLEQLWRNARTVVRIM
jgi:ribosome-associated protein